jgi:hypothetical protein
MAEHEPSIGMSDDWFTPPEIFTAPDLTFELDPCSPGPGHWVPARRIHTAFDDGLAQPWSGLVFMKIRKNAPSAAYSQRAQCRPAGRVLRNGADRIANLTNEAVAA